MIVILLAGAFLILIAGMIHRRVPLDGYASPMAAVGVGATFYLVGIPVEAEIIGRRAIFLRTVVPFTQSESIEVVVLAALAMLLLYIGYVLVAPRTNMGAIAFGADEIKVAIQSLSLLSAGLLGIACLRYSDQLLSAHDYESAYSDRYAGAGYAFVIASTYLVLSMLAACLLMAGRRAAGFTIVVLLAGWGIYANQKWPIVLAALAVLVLIDRRVHRPRFAQVTAAAFAAPLVLGASTLMFSVYRGHGDLSQAGEIAKTGSLNKTEAAGPFASIIAELRQGGSSAPDSAPMDSVLQGMVGWVPRALWPDRPLDLAEQFARANIPDWHPGMGYGYSPLAEGLHQGGVLGLLLYFLLLGMVIGAVYRWAVSRSRSGGRMAFAVYARTGFVALLLTSFRTPFQGIVTTLVQSLAVVAIAVALMIILGAVVRRQPAGGESRSSSFV